MKIKHLSEKTCRDISSEIKRLTSDIHIITVIIVHEDNDREALHIGSFICNDRRVVACSLNPESTVKLFGKSCPDEAKNVEPILRGPELLWEVMTPTMILDAGFTVQEWNLKLDLLEVSKVGKSCLLKYID
jgi:hypothetical protein